MTEPLRSRAEARAFPRAGALQAHRTADLVRIERNWLSGSLPTRVTATSPALSLHGWIAANRELLRAELTAAGGILFRGFAVRDAADFSAAARALASDLIDYKERSSPRSRIDHQVYTSTDHPPDQPIFLHNEQSYTVDWPLFILFFCQQEPGRRGATPLADNRRLLARLPAAIRERFARLGVLYVRNYSPGVGLAWRDAFQTDSRAEVEAFCARNHIRWRWLPDEHLRTWQRRSAFQRHPITGEIVWFNHALFFHASSLVAEVRDALAAALPESDLPTNTYFGDGTPMDAETLAALRFASEAETVRFDWRTGDVLALDNMLAQHGREPFEGPRRVLTAMAAPYRTLATPDVPETPVALTLGGGR